jgi:hypothetical protein
MLVYSAYPVTPLIYFLALEIQSLGGFGWLTDWEFLSVQQPFFTRLEYL